MKLAERLHYKHSQVEGNDVHRDEFIAAVDEALEEAAKELESLPNKAISLTDAAIVVRALKSQP